jgi:uncharacterized sulfatase
MRLGISRPGAIALALALLALAAAAAEAGRGRGYGLAPEEVAEGVYVFWGLQEDWGPKNGGNIVNTGFIVGEKEVLVVDTGPTRFYAEEMIAVIRAHTDLPIRTAVVTHHHPDHAFGIKQFKRINARVLMHPEARRWLVDDGETVRGFMEIVIGVNWMAGTEVDARPRLIKREKRFDLGGRVVRVALLPGGHTAGDLIVIDEATGTLFASDLVFNQRVPTVPHADIPVWLDHLDTLARMEWQRLVPGHGPLMHDAGAFEPMTEYLRYLLETAREEVAEGAMLAESLTAAPPERFAGLTSLGTEFPRSIQSLFRKLEAEDFDSAVAAY